MNCKACDYPHSEVIRVTHDDNNNLNLRRRQCLRCGKRYSTIEYMRPIKEIIKDDALVSAL